jgi:4-phospho-D-threonate 3-dehydrogenase / 4-phospho-D-erythronate 3-dehydrogenase
MSRRRSSSPMFMVPGSGRPNGGSLPGFARTQPTPSRLSDLGAPELEPRPRGLARPDPEPPPLVAVTMGDPAGVGPEVVVKAIRSGECFKDCRPVVVGGREIMQEACRRFGEPMKLRSITLDELPKEFDSSVLYLVEALGADLKRVVPGSHSGTTGRAAAAAVRLAAKLATDGKVRAITTAPISKEAFLDLGIGGFTGHTEFLAGLSAVKRSAPMFISPRLRVTLVTTHLPLGQVARTLSKKRILDTIELTHIAMRKFFARLRPRIAVAGLNPHCGEAGRLGNEEAEKITPAIAAARARGIDVHGPISGDSVFLRAMLEEFDCVVAMYHDQGLGPVRALGRGRVVNLSLGIPFLRTSVEHGTAPDIAWKGKASEESMTAALRTAGRMASRLDPGPIEWSWRPPGETGGGGGRRAR